MYDAHFWTQASALQSPDWVQSALLLAPWLISGGLLGLTLIFRRHMAAGMVSLFGFLIAWGVLSFVLFAVGCGVFILIGGMWILALGPSPELLNPYNWFIPGGAGFHYMGILIGGYLGGLVTKRALEVKEMIGDPFALGLPAMMILLRIGCFLGRCCYGKPSHLPWAVYLIGACHHPTQLYEGLFQVAALAVLWRWRDCMPRPGDLLKAYYFAYALFRFGQQFLRDDHPVAALGLTVPHFLALGILAWLAIRLRSRLHQRSDQAAGMPAAQVAEAALRADRQACRLMAQGRQYRWAIEEELIYRPRSF